VIDVQAHFGPTLLAHLTNPIINLLGAAVQSKVGVWVLLNLAAQDNIYEDLCRLVRTLDKQVAGYIVVHNKGVPGQRLELYENSDLPKLLATRHHINWFIEAIPEGVWDDLCRVEEFMHRTINLDQAIDGVLDWDKETPVLVSEREEDGALVRDPKGKPLQIQSSNGRILRAWLIDAMHDLDVMAPVLLPADTFAAVKDRVQWRLNNWAVTHATPELTVKEIAEGLGGIQRPKRRFTSWGKA
jgi:hypothetical protein